MVYEVASLTKSLKEEPIKASVKLKMHAVEKFGYEYAFVSLSDTDVGELQNDVAPLVRIDEDDQFALRFDALMYGYMIAVIRGESTSMHRRKLVNIAVALEEKATVPQVKEKLPTIQRVNAEGVLDKAGMIELDDLRLELRDLVKFIADQNPRAIVTTNLNDPVTLRQEGELLDFGEEFADYKLKVNRYINENGDKLIIHKLRNNLPMTQVEFDELERIFTEELGTKRDYRTAYEDTPFGLLVRKIAGLDHEAVMAAFADFINDEALNPQQVAFVRKVVEFVEENGSMEPSALAKAPFDRPTSFFRLFDDGRQKRLVQIIRQIHANATEPAA